MRTLLLHHVVSVLVAGLTLAFAASALRTRRPTGSAFAWLLGIALVPYLGIPLYLVFGGRKFRSRARGKAPLAWRPAAVRATAAGPPDAPSVTTVRWLDDGVAAYEALVAAIDGAGQTIDVETFILGDDPTGRAVVARLIAKAHQGVTVRVLLDDLFRRRAPAAALRELVAAGGHVARFMPIWHLPFRGRVNLRNHRKVTIVDGQVAIVGGMNVAHEYMGPTTDPHRWRDLAVQLTGPAVENLGAVFEADWRFAAHAPLATPPPPAVDTTAQVIPSGPDCADDAIYDALLTAVFQARRRCWIATPYFVPDDALARALAIAARRGVDVRVVVPARSNHALADLVAAPALRELAAAGGHVFRYTPTMLHAKTVLIDDHTAMVGSANFDMRSMFLDYEITLAFSGPPEIACLERWFAATVATATPGPAPAGWARRQLENLGRLLAPLI